MTFNISGKNILSKSDFLAFLSSAVAVLLLTVHNKFMPPFLIAWLLFWAAGFISKHARIEEDEKRARLLLFFFLALNLIFLAGLLFSENTSTGSVLFFRRLSLIIFPVILFSPGYNFKKRIDILLIIFVAGITCFMLFCFGNALFNSIILKDGSWSFNAYLPDQPWLNYFYGELLSMDQHPTYIAMYVFLGILISLEFISRESELRMKIIWMICTVFLFIGLYFLSSRASYLAVLVIFPVFLWIKFKPLKFKLLSALSLITLLVLVSYVYLGNQRVRIYFDKTMDNAVLNDGRMEIWKSALKVVEKNPLFGAGIGDYYAAMDKEFKDSQYSAGYYKDFNAHNQYLEILCISGIIGFLIFAGIIVIMLYTAVKDRNLLYGAFIIMVLIFFSFESVLSRFAGNSFFALFAFLLIYYKGPVKRADHN